MVADARDPILQKKLQKPCKTPESPLKNEIFLVLEEAGGAGCYYSKIVTYLSPRYPERTIYYNLDALEKEKLIDVFTDKNQKKAYLNLEGYRVLQHSSLGVSGGFVRVEASQYSWVLGVSEGFNRDLFLKDLAIPGSIKPKPLMNWMRFFLEARLPAEMGVLKGFKLAFHDGLEKKIVLYPPAAWGKSPAGARKELYDIIREVGFCIRKVCAKHGVRILFEDFVKEPHAEWPSLMAKANHVLTGDKVVKDGRGGGFDMSRGYHEEYHSDMERAEFYFRLPEIAENLLEGIRGIYAWMEEATAVLKRLVPPSQDLVKDSAPYSYREGGMYL